MDVYDNPQYYDLAFSFRDIPAEVDFLEKVIARYSQVPVKTFLEVASGNSPHLKELCKRGYHYIGLEMNPAMVKYVREQIRRDSLNAKIIKGDMIRFSLPKPADCAAIFLGSLYVKSDEELHNHLASVAHSLKKGGLYILDGVVSYYPHDVHSQSWEMERGMVKMKVSYKASWVNKKEGLMKGDIILDIKEDNTLRRIQHSEIRKIYTKDRFVSLAERIGFWKEVGSFSDFNIHRTPKQGARNILVLRRR